MMARLHVSINGIWGITDRPLQPIVRRCQSPIAIDCLLLSIARYQRSPVTSNRLLRVIAHHGQSPVAGMGRPIEPFQLFIGGLCRGGLF